jgi:hydroxymethylpyrimidine pyrophosphatase-like HAD family hydrolase
LDYDLLAIDLDGTLLDTQHALPLANREALHRAHAAGLKIVLCTGRAFAETRPVLAQIGLDLDATVTVFGALVTDVATGRTLERTSIPLDVALAVTAWFQRDGFPVLWLTDPDEAGDDGFVLAGPRRHPAVDQWIERSPCVVRNLAQLPEHCAAPVRISIIDENNVLEHVSARLRAAFDGRLTHNVLHAPPYRLSLIEAFAPQVNKWYGVEKLCGRWGIDPRRTVAIGDDVNDVAMIRNAGLGIAVANARPVVQAAADRVTDTNDACGVARVINELFSAVPEGGTGH